SEDGVLLKNSIVEAALALRPDLIRMLLTHEGLKNNFFVEVDGMLVFDKVRFQKFVMNKRFLADSYTSFKNKIGLTGEDDEFLAESREVVLSWPYKDCVLEGGQTKEDAKRNEVFWNEILAPDEINRLTEPKVLTNFAKYDADGKHEVAEVSDQDNLIIKGNNLLALHSLLKKYRGKVKLIYIDPPYNTGNDGFQYNDSFKHSSWLTFMRNRLTLARELLRKDGSIWVSIDDDEQGYLKALIDEIFGRHNFINNIVWEKKYAPSNDAKWLSDSHDFIILYAKDKDIWRPNLLERGDKQNQYYKYDDNDGRGHWRSDNVLVKTFSKFGVFAIVNPNTEQEFFPPEGSCYHFNEETTKRLVAENRLYFGKDGKGAPQLKRYLSEVKQGVTSLTLWKREDVGDNQDAKYEVNKLDTTDSFDTPKPEKLIQRIMLLGSNKGDLVLDYHLGSGTTAAVAHKMGRRYIGVEQMDYIETVAVERLRKVIGAKKEGAMFGDEHDCDQGGISKAVGWKGGGSFVYCELAKANQNFVDQIEVAATKEQLTTIWEQMQQSGFLSWKISPKIINAEAKAFADLSVDDTRRFLIESLDKNLLYIPLSEIDNEEFAISDSDKKLNSQFYGK
ncbi:MAG: site-specific DNA-methyltransferase, partial [Bacteroidales bacterium]